MIGVKGVSVGHTEDGDDEKDEKEDNEDEEADDVRTAALLDGPLEVGVERTRLCEHKTLDIGHANDEQ